MVSDLVDFNETEVDATVSSRRLHGEVRSYVGNVYRYHRQYIYDVVLYQYQQDQLTADASQNHARNVLMEILGDAQQVSVHCWTVSYSYVVRYLDVWLLRYASGPRQTNKQTDIRTR